MIFGAIHCFGPPRIVDVNHIHRFLILTNAAVICTTARGDNLNKWLLNRACKGYCMLSTQRNYKNLQARII